jgi:transposase
VSMSGDNSKPTELVARRVRSDDEKRAIVAEASQGFRNASAVARRHGIKPSLLFRWKKQFASKAAPDSTLAPNPFVPVTLALPSPAPETAAPFVPNKASLIEIEVAGGRKLRVGADIDIGALKRIVAALETR